MLSQPKIQMVWIVISLQNIVVPVKKKSWIVSSFILNKI